MYAVRFEYKETHKNAVLQYLTLENSKENENVVQLFYPLVKLKL